MGQEALGRVWKMNVVEISGPLCSVWLAATANAKSHIGTHVCFPQFFLYLIV